MKMKKKLIYKIINLDNATGSMGNSCNNCAGRNTNM